MGETEERSFCELRWPECWSGWGFFLPGSGREAPPVISVPVREASRMLTIGHLLDPSICPHCPVPWGVHWGWPEGSAGRRLVVGRGGRPGISSLQGSCGPLCLSTKGNSSYWVLSHTAFCSPGLDAVFSPHSCRPGASICAPVIIVHEHWTGLSLVIL